MRWFSRKTAPRVQPAPPAAPPPQAVKQEPSIEWGPSGHVGYSDDEVHFRVNTAAEAKLALQDLRLRKRELTAAKRVVNERQREIRANYTDGTRHRTPMVRGKGTVARIVRAGQQASRTAAKNNLANALRPNEQQKRSLESESALIDQAILKVEGYILERKAKDSAGA